MIINTYLTNPGLPLIISDCDAAQDSCTRVASGYTQRKKLTVFHRDQVFLHVE